MTISSSRKGAYLRDKFEDLQHLASIFNLLLVITMKVDRHKYVFKNCTTKTINIQVE